MSSKILLALAMLFSIALAGCSSEKRLDGTNSDTLKSSWKEMYQEAPEAERKDFIRGSAFLIFEVAGPVFFEETPFNSWDSLAIIEYLGRSRIITEVRPDIIQQFDGKSRSDIIDFRDSYDINEEISQGKLEAVVDRTIL